MSDAPPQILIICEHGAAAARGHGLVPVETEATHATEGPCMLALKPRTKGFGCIFDDVDVESLCKTREVLHVAHIAQHVHRHDGTDAPPILRQDALSPVVDSGVHCEELLEQAGAKVEEWEVIRDLIPSTDIVFSLSPTRPPGSVALQPDEWQVLAHVDGFQTVGGIICWDG